MKTESGRARLLEMLEGIDRCNFFSKLKLFMENEKRKSTSWALDEALGILSVDNVTVSPFALELLACCERGEITAEQVREAIRVRAESFSVEASK